MALTHATLWDTVKELVLEQYKDSVNLVSLIKTMVEECAQSLEDGAFSLQDFFNLDDAEGAWLDLLGKLVGLKRYGGESDTDFKNRIERATSNISAGTPDSVIYNAAINSGDPKPAYIDEADATFFVYTGPKPSSDGWIPGGKRLNLSQTRKMAPAGVLGLPGLCLKLGNGARLGTADGKMMLVVAGEEKHLIRTGYIVTSDNKKILTSDGKHLSYYVKEY